MSSSKDYLDFILEQLEGLDGITTRAMMGEFIIYLNGKILGGIYDDRLLVKPVPSARLRMPEALLEAPYEGAKKMLLVDRVDDGAFLRELFCAMESELPAAKAKKGRITPA